MNKLQTDIAKLSQSKAELAALVQKMGKQDSLMKIKATQVFIFDLRDYVESLSVITDLEKKSPQNNYDMKYLNLLLTQQNELLSQIIDRIKFKPEEAESLDFSEGQLRRTVSSLEEIKILNNLILQDNLNFQYYIENEWEKRSANRARSKRLQVKHFFKNLLDQTKLRFKK